MTKTNCNNWIDRHLKSCLAKRFNKTEDEITKEFLVTLREINLSDQNIKSLSGIEYAKNLTSLVLNNNNIKDANMLSELIKLQNLELNENRIEDLSFLKKLTKLRSLSLDSNNICNIPNLSDLKNLNLMNISNNRVQDFSFVNKLSNKAIKIIASDQFIYLNPISVDIGDSYIFNLEMPLDDDNSILYDNVQVTGDYEEFYTDKRPSFLYSISEVKIRNICSNCVIKADFYHEVLFSKSVVLSGVLIQPLILNSTPSSFNLECEETNLYSISGKICFDNNDNIKNKIVTIIDSEGNKYYSTTDLQGRYRFNNLKEDRYTLLFPFLNDYEYLTPSLYVINLKEKKSINIDAFISPK